MNVKSLPADIAAEKGVLCSVLMDPDLLASLDLIDTHFHHSAHSTIWRAFHQLRVKGTAIDLVTLTGFLKDQGELENVGGARYLADLLAFIPTSTNVTYYADIVREKARLREMIAVSEWTTKELYAPGAKPEYILEKTTEDLKEIGEALHRKRERRINFYKPSEIVNYSPEHDILLVGENAVLRGEIFVIGGEPGVGKSTAATELAVCGALGRDWLGLKTHRKFKTLIIQNENGRYRLQQEYAARGLCYEIENHILVSEPPPFGMTLNNPDFLGDLKIALDAFSPDVVVFDPWNAAAKDDKARDYSAAFDALRGMLPTDRNKPALGIVAHTRKPQSNEKRTGGTALLHLLAGSYVLSSQPRSVFIMLRGSTNETDSSVIWCNPKNNNGPLAHRTAWMRGPSGFSAIPDFDWNSFDESEGGRKFMTLELIQDALGDEKWERSRAVELLRKQSGFGLRSCQKALSKESAWAAHLAFEDNLIGLKTIE